MFVVMFQSAQTLSLNDDHIIVIMVIFSLILAGMCFTFIFNCIKKLIRDHQTIQVGADFVFSRTSNCYASLNIYSSLLLR